LFLIRAGFVFVITKDRYRVCVFVDGSNLYHRLRESGWPTNVDIAEFGRDSQV